ncbi:MAG: tetratricopeptide repeat protein, partial [Vibrio sp.]
MNLSKKLLLTCLVSASFFSSFSWAQGVTVYTQSRLLAAERQQQAGQLDKAIETLTSTKAKANYDQAFVARMLGIYYWEKGDANQSIASLQKALDLKVLDQEASWQTCRMLADVLYSEQKSNQAIKEYQALLGQTYRPQTASARTQYQAAVNQVYFRLAAAFYQKQD